MQPAHIALQWLLTNIIEPQFRVLLRKSLLHFNFGDAMSIKGDAELTGLVEELESTLRDVFMQYAPPGAAVVAIDSYEAFLHDSRLFSHLPQVCRWVCVRVQQGERD